MNSKLAATLVALSAVAAVPAFAQTPAAPANGAAAAAAMASGPISVDKTPISEIIKNEKAKAALETALPPITQYYDQIGGMTLAQVAPMSQGALDDAKLKALQVEFDKINAAGK
ncbi:MAG: hypothetical protein E7812_17365 [Phenylobacterium sp.]|nr:MAG: hypothetical protein E7812_17365 [Phenylobacterium sp.]